MDLNFDNQGYFTIPLWGNLRLIVNDTVIGTWIIGAALIILAIIVRVKFKKFKEVPDTKFQNFIEMIVEFFDGIVVSMMGRKYAKFGNWFFGVFCFFWISNISGIFGMRPPTADLATTFAMGASTVALMFICGARYSGKEWVKDFFRPIPIFLPMNILGDVSKAISLSCRLFGNILGGTIMMGMLYALPWFVRIGPPGVLSFWMDIFVGSLQAYVFIMLSMAFIRMKAPQED
ncbi:MAG: F0F1 ATP synthase subunit A [Defluviitaleaceae bacterium]|nr:F0F1 ATP synthase subunit A [Defluviitaleaceae bacterium]